VYHQSPNLTADRNETSRSGISGREVHSKHSPIEGIGQINELSRWPRNERDSGARRIPAVRTESHDQFLRGGLGKSKSAKLCQRMFPEMQILVLVRGSEKTHQGSRCPSNRRSGQSRKLLDFRPCHNHVLN
jgi:hypothetical protein